MTTTTRNSITILAFAALAGFASATNAQTIFCRPTTWFNPNGTASAPFSNIAAAACASTPNGTIQLTPGTYFEQGTFNTPTRITSASGPSTIGLNATERTTFKVMSYNTHLFGAFPLPVWQDEDRAIAMGLYFNQRRAEGVDLVGLQEVWASNRWDNIWALSLYPGRAYGGRVDSGNTQNSGLAALSLNPILGGTQVSYTDDNGNDASASKGFLILHIQKGNFHLGVFITHTQSGSDSNDVSDRALQMQQLATNISVYRALYPSHAILALGDFNMSYASTEFTSTLSNQMGGVGALADTSRNLACLGDADQCTTCADNTVRQAFGGTGNDRIDYIFYGNSADGSVKFIPKAYQVLRPSSPNLISGTGWNPETFSDFTLSSHILSDHEALYAEFELVRN
jgi:endonuclease/exonuclease/phosphatase family metal-dependent hydrolase